MTFKRFWGTKTADVSVNPCEAGLAAGGLAWPNFPELLELLPADPSAETGTSPVTPEEVSSSLVDRFKRDPAGNTLSVIVLLGMIASVAYTVVDGRHALRLQRVSPGAPSPEWLVPVLALAGLGVAGYLT